MYTNEDQTLLAERHKYIARKKIVCLEYIYLNMPPGFLWFFSSFFCIALTFEDSLHLLHIVSKLTVALQKHS